MSEPLSARKVQQALTYLAKLNSDDPLRVEQAHKQLARWRSQSSEHEHAWLEAERRWQMIHRLTPQLRGTVQSQPVNLSRRRLLRQGTGLLAVIGASGWLSWLWRETRPFTQSLLTEHAEPSRPVTLPDGSELLLAAESNVRVEFSHAQRQIMLMHGNVYFDVAHETLRSFVINTRLGQIKVLGTAFSVSDRGGCIQVAVARGRVHVQGLKGEAKILTAGQHVSLNAQGEMIALNPHRQAGPDIENWRKGWWSYTDAPLSEVLAEYNAYAARPVRVSADAAHLRLTGSFPSDKPQMLLQTLPRILPVQLVNKAGELYVQLR
ncbi:FecR family protein [Pseudomonas helleri]|uniref:FecR family protein n=1 Tax=Pseudomonas helleri TaxID=1608996 RepID=UPI003F9463CF